MNTVNSNNKQSNTILLHAVGIRAIDGETLAVDIPGGTMTLIFASRDAMRHTASVIIAATDLSDPVTIDETAVEFQSPSNPIIPRIPSNSETPPDDEDESEDESEDEEESEDLPNLLGDGGYETDETEYIGEDTGLTQELNF